MNRIKIGLVYNYNEQWVAGAYYILNLIHALNKLEDIYKPELIVLSLSEDNLDVMETNYPYLKFHQLNKSEFSPVYFKLERGMNRLSQIVLGKNIIKKETKYRLKVPLDLIFPASDHVYFSEIKNKLFWIPDFQEHFLPQFFSENEIRSRKLHQLHLSKEECYIVFSSCNALSHFKSIYPASKAKTFVLQFAVTHPEYKSINTNELFSKFLIDRPYFFCPNQVWAHKNHITVLKAIKELKERYKYDILVVFSGKQYDNRNPEVFKKLESYVSQFKLEENVKFLGFIDRREQLQLMNKALGVIQPSLFEGWSTSIEDAKAMNQFVIASDLPVHKEQIKTNVVYFQSMNENQLQLYLKKFLDSPPLTTNNNEYETDIFNFGKQFLKIVNTIVSR